MGEFYWNDFPTYRVRTLEGLNANIGCRCVERPPGIPVLRKGGTRVFATTEFFPAWCRRLVQQMGMLA